MIKKIKYQNITWLSLLAPTKEETTQIEKDYGIHPLVSEELTSPSARVKVDFYDNYIYLILHFPIEKINHSDLEGQTTNNAYEVDFVLGKDFLITAHYENVPPLEEFSKILEASGGLIEKQKNKELHAGHLFYYILRQLYQSLESGLDNINDNLRRAEKKIFAGQEAEMVKTLSNLNRHLLDFRWALNSHREILDSFALVALEFYGNKFNYYAQSIIGEQEKISQQLDNNRENFSELRSTNESLLSIKINNIMKILTGLTAIFLPVTLISQIFGMSGSETNMPIIKTADGFYWALAMMLLTGLIMTIIARIKKWI